MSDQIEEERQVKINPPARFLITPERVGRHSNVAPFEVALGSHFQDTPDMVAHRISREIKSMLVSAEFVVTVDLGDGKFSLQGGRFGGGTIEKLAD